MWLMMFCIISLLFPVLGHAATASWGPNDPVVDFAGVNIYRAPGSCATPGAFVKVDTALKPLTSEVLTNPSADGVYCHRATAFDTSNNESVFSNTAEFQYNVVPPLAPRLFTVTP